MLKQYLPSIRLSIGFGKNNFTMSHGSFSYDEEFTYRKELHYIGAEAPEEPGASASVLYLPKR